MSRYFVDYYSQHVLDEIESWPVGILADYARLVELRLEFGPALGMPYCWLMGRALFELRPRGPEGMGRALYCFAVGRRIVVVHAFVKKTRTTPKTDVAIARRRMKEVRDGQK
jgi:phage-related protein